MNFFYNNYRHSTYRSHKKWRTYDIYFFTIFAIISYVSKKYPQALIPIIISICVLAIFILIIKHIFLQNYYKNSISLVDKKFVYKKNTIKNQNCIIQYFPNRSISVTENAYQNQMKNIRTFTISSKDIWNINKCWNDICKIFMENTFFDSIYSYIQNIYDIDINTVSVPVSRPPQNPLIEKIPQNQNSPRPNNNKNLNNIPKDYSNEKTDKNNTNNTINQNGLDIITSQELCNMEDLIQRGNNKQSQKLNVNKASAEEISKLPGINIVAAKKIVDFRNKERTFRSVDDFIKIAATKEYFAQQIKDLITVETDDGDTSDGGERIIDL